MIVALPIPHTGTHTLRDLLYNGTMGKEYTVIHPWPDHTKSSYDKWHELLEPNPPIICTVRHPLAVALSWKRRGKDYQELSWWWRQQWGVIDAFRPYYIAMDRPELRDWQLRKIDLELGTCLGGDPNTAIEWPMHREDPAQTDYSLDLTPEETRDVLLNHYAAGEPFFNRWYGS